jgi:PAS domain S-box-containing protein
LRNMRLGLETSYAPGGSKVTVRHVGATGIPDSIDPGLLGQSMLAAAGAAGIGVTVAFLDSGSPNNAYVSPVAARIVGWSVDELLRDHALAHVAPRDRERLEERWSQRQKGEAGEMTYEVMVVRKDGREVPVEVTASRTEIAGRPAVFTFLFDVSARHDAERLKHENDVRFRELVDAAPEFIGIIRDGRFVYANRAYAMALGFASTEELTAVPISTLVDRGDVDVQRAREVAVVTGGARQAPYVYRAMRRDGTQLLLEASSVPFQYEGKASVLTMARDVTEKRQLERQLVQADRLAALGTMAAGVAHEINNPLAYVMLNLEWIARKLPDVQADPANLPALQAMLDEARQGAARVSTIVRELRSFARADSETRRRVDLASVVQSAIKIVGNELRHRARVVTSFEPTRGVVANEARLEQVVVNLLLNAAQAMPEVTTENNEVRVTVREDGDRRAVLEVHDNGVGIPPTVLPRIFDPFFSTKPVGVGTGLGLSICHGIVTSLGGQIRAYSEPGEGATFRIVLPTVDATADSTPPPSDAPPSMDLVRARVLVVDDEPAIGTTLHELLAPLHEVVAVTGAREALEKIAAETFDVVFCDLMMPGMSGIDLFERLRGERAGIEDRIVFMTGGAFTPRAAEFLASVPNRRMEKPFSLGLVERIVREMVAPGGTATIAP